MLHYTFIYAGLLRNFNGKLLLGNLYLFASINLFFVLHKRITKNRNLLSLDVDRDNIKKLQH